MEPNVDEEDEELASAVEDEGVTTDRGGVVVESNDGEALWPPAAPTISGLLAGLSPTLAAAQNAW